MYPAHPQHPPGAIGLELDFGFFANNSPASTSWFSRKYNTWVEVDGMAYEREGGAWHVLPVHAGWHLVRVYFRVRPGFLSGETGAQQIQVLVHPNTMARLKYEGGLLWPLTSGTLVQVG